MCVDERCPHLYYYDDLLLLRLRLTTTPYSFSSPKHSPLLHASRPLFLKIQRIFKFFLFGKHHIHSSHTHFFFRTASLRFGPKMKRTAASNGVASPPSVVVAAEKPKRKKRRSAYDRTERRRRRNKESRSKAATEETARAFWIESVESHHQRV